MATSGKKNKKVKRKAVPLQDFLGGEGANVITAQITKVVAPASWVDECDEDEIQYDRPLQAFSLPTAPRASRAMDDVPEVAPFIAHLSNLPFEIDDEDIYDFFNEQEVESLRLPREDAGGRSRGFGYIEFKSRNDLIAALMMPDPHIRNRRIRIDVSTESDQKRGSGGRYGRDSGFGDTSNWRKEGGSGGGGSRGDDEGGRGRSYGMNREREQRDWPSTAGDEGGNWRDNMKKRSDSPQSTMRRGAYGGDRGDRGDRGERDGGDRYGGSSGDRYMGRGSGGRYEDRAPVARSENEPAERPKLVLQKRTLPLPEIVTVLDGEVEGGAADGATAAREVKVSEEEEDRPLAKPLPAADIFGEAKPVDTAARERELEERLERERVAREEAADAARKERAAAAEAARAAAAASASASPTETTTSNGDKGADSGVATSPSSDGGDAVKDSELVVAAEETAAPATVTSWRRKANAEDGAAAEEEGDRRAATAGGVRRDYNRRDNDRDFGRRGDYNNQRDNSRGRNNDNYGRAGRADGVRDNYRSGGGEDRPLRRNENNATAQQAGDENVAPREPQEPRMPKYKEPTNTKLATTNAFEFLDDEGSD